MIEYDYNRNDGYQMFVVEWKAPAPLRVMGELSKHIKSVKFTKEGLVEIHFGSYGDLPADIRETVDRDDLLRALILYLPHQLVEINRHGEPQAYIKWVPAGKQGTQCARFTPNGSDEFEMVFLCKSITKQFLNNMSND